MTFWTNASLKGHAREKLRGRWPAYLAVTLAFLLITEGVSQLITYMFPEYETLIAEITDLATAGSYPDMDVIFPLLLNLYSVVGVITGITLAVSMLVFTVLQVGLHRWYMEARDGSPRFSTLFSGFFSGSQWRNVVWVQFCTSLFTMLWGMLFFIPGIIYAYKVYLVPYLLAENPYMPRKRAIELSKALTEGEKMRIFWLEFSFIGWIMLISLAESLLTMLSPAVGSIAVFIGNIFLTVYMNAALAEFYATMREKAFQLGLSDATELAGFAS